MGFPPGREKRMKIREEQVERICRTILSRWKEKGMIRPKADDALLLGKMIGEVMADFRREEELDREVHAILEKHSRDLADSQASSHVMFLKIKERLARERKIVL
ncbi:MAG TPA: hypothetical protein DEH27_05665 [Deltaproteobacteria bacterium]|nr:hypothetical protein [Deltaproteobacteria bacterium]